jgi:hypothetical protein
MEYTVMSSEIVVPGIVVLTCTLLTISILSIRVALVNPVNSLKE